MDRQEIEEFIWKVFNYYNGRINIVNRAVLNINWAARYGRTEAGFSYAPNIVMINAGAAKLFYGEDIPCIKLNIIETIIHELYHTDQLINYNKLQSDTNYVGCIEAACEVQTAIYMLNHINEIYDLFDIDVFDAVGYYEQSLANFDAYGYPYIRRTKIEHIFLCLDNMIDFSHEYGMNFMKTLLEFCNCGKNISIIVNNKTKLYICISGELIDLWEFNKYIGNIHHDFLDESSMGYEYDENELKIKLDYVFKNVICTLAR